MSGSTRLPSTDVGAAPSGTFGRRILDLADQLAAFSEAPHHLACTYLTPAHRAAASQIESWMRAAKLDASIDAVGNVVGRRPGGNPGARTVIVGSHYDTVRNAGKYDGRIGILTAIVVAEFLQQQRLPFNLEIIAFAEEEGIRFGTAYLGSSAVAGRFDARSLERRDATGITVADAIRSAGGNPAAIPALARSPQELLAYLEVHIEQGPVLLEAGLPLGIVTAIDGCVRFSVAITGVAGHAGTVPMNARRDAAAAAAELTLYLERRCQREPGLVGTVGQIEIPNGAINVISGRCELTLDIRADEETRLNAAIADVLTRVREIENERRVTVELAELQRTPVVPCSPKIQSLLANSIADAGLPVRMLPSGAGHDAVMFHGLTDIGMLFVRCGNGGVSHNPLETITEDDADIAARVLLHSLLKLDDTL